MAAASHFDRIMAEARMRLPGAIDEALKVELFGVLDEFFRRTILWQEDIPIGVVPDKRAYDIDSNEWVAIVDQLLYALNKDNIPVHAIMMEPGVLTLRNYPENVQTYTIRVSLTTADTLDEDGYPQIPIWVIVKYHEAFKDGVLSRMAMQPAKPYYNKELAIYHGSRFRSSMNAAFDDAKRKNLFDGQNWLFPQNFATSRRQ